jgi:hypothetical protein
MQMAGCCANSEQELEEKSMTPAELQCLFEGLPADHEWFDAVMDACAALDPSLV